MDFSKSSPYFRGNGARVANYISQAADGATACIGIYDADSGQFEKLWIGLGADGSIDQGRAVSAVLKRDIRRPTDAHVSHPMDEENLAWIRSDRALIALGRELGPRRAVAALVAHDADAPTCPNQWQLVQIGLVYAVQCLEDHLRERRRFQSRMAESILASLSVNTAVVDAQGGLIYQGQLSEEWLSRRCQIDIVRNRLVARTKQVQLEMQGAIEAATSDEFSSSILRLECKDGGPTGVVVMPLGQTPARALIVFGEDSADLPLGDLLLQTFGLTSAERRLAHCLLSGQSVQEAAEELSITTATARSYLKRVFSKTNIHRQSELIALYHRTMPPVRMPEQRGKAKVRLSVDAATSDSAPSPWPIRGVRARPRAARILSATPPPPNT